MSDTPIHALALLSDGRGAALCSPRGAIEWCCAPRFDHGSCFGALLDPAAGACRLEIDGEERQGTASYRAGTLNHVVTFDRPDAAITLEDALVPDAEPLRLARVVRAEGRGAEVVIRIAARFDDGQVRPWVRGRGERAALIGGDDALVLAARGGVIERDGDHDVTVRATLGDGEALELTVAFVAAVDADATRSALDCTAARDLEQAAVTRAERLAGMSEAVRATPALARSALTLLALVYEPTGAIIAAPTTSLPESRAGTRTWDYRYAWIRDATWTSRALESAGIPEVGDAFSAFTMRSTAGHPEDMQVVYGVGGERWLDVHELPLRGWRGAGPVRIGNDAIHQVQRDEPGEILQQCRDRHGRGYRFDEDEWRYIARLADHVAATWERPGHGFWENPTEPRRYVYGIATSYAALDAAIALASARDIAPHADWVTSRDRCAAVVLGDGYDDARGTFRAALDGDDLDATALLLPTTRIVDWDDPRMRSTADAIMGSLDDAGLLRRYDAADGLPGREGCFIACTFWLAECLARQGRTDEARAWFDRASATASPLGLFSEEWDTATGEPLGNYPQGLSHVAHLQAGLAIAGAAGTLERAELGSTGR